MPTARDFEARFVTDTSQFDTSGVVADLDSVEHAATGATDKVRTEGGKLKSAGSEAGRGAGQALGEGLRSALSNGDIGGALQSVAGSLAGLGVAGLGIGLGVSIVANIMSGMKRQQEELEAATRKTFESIIKTGRAAAQKAATEAALVDTLQDPEKRAYLALLGVTPEQFARASGGVQTDIDSLQRKLDQPFNPTSNSAAGRQAEYERHARAVRAIRTEVDDLAQSWDAANRLEQDYFRKARDSYTDQIYNPRRVRS